jgi:hypothetical protein
VCIGKPGDAQPFVATWNLREAGTSRPRRLRYLFDLCDKLFRTSQIDIVRFEAPMRLAAMGKMGTSEEVMLLLRGAIGVLECAASRAEIEDIGSFDVQDARQHFLGQRRFPKGKNGKSAAKDMVLRQCEILGIEVHDDNSADAVAGWSYCCALANPRIAHHVTPLFIGKSA